MSCAQELQQIHRLKELQKQNFGIGSRPPVPAAVSTYSIFALILLIVGIYLSYTRPGIDYLTLAMSAVFFTMAAISYRRYRDACPQCN